MVSTVTSTGWKKRDLQSLIKCAEVASGAKDWRSAAALWGSLLRIQGDKSPRKTYVRLSQAQRNLKQFDVAEDTLRRAMIMHPANVDVTFACEAANIATIREDYLEALARWQVVFDLFPVNTPVIAYVRKSLSYRMIGKFDFAADTVHAGLNKYPLSSRLLRERDLVLLQGGHRRSNPYEDRKLFENLGTAGLGAYPTTIAERRWHKVRQELYRHTGEAARVQQLRGAHFGRRCFILGNGPSLRQQDLSLLQNEITFVTNWFVNAENYDLVGPNYYCVSSHEMFGGWNKPSPTINKDFYAAMQSRARQSMKFFSFAFRDYINQEQLFPGEDLRFLLFERPKRLVDEIGEINLDLNTHLDDAYTVVLTMCVPLAVHMGFSEIVLLGCDCDYGIQTPDDPKHYFYDSRLHTSATSKFESLQRIWADDGPVFRAYEIVNRELQDRGVRLRNATEGGRLDVIPRVSYRDLFLRSPRLYRGSSVRTAFCTVANDEFVPGLAVLLHSILQYHPDFNLPYVVLHNARLSSLSACNREYLGRIYDGVVFKEVDETVYESCWEQRVTRLRTPERLKPAFFILDAFSLTEYDRVVTLDSDMICLGDISELSSMTSDLAVTQAWNYTSGLPLDYFNTGVMVIGPRHLTGDTYRRLLKHKVSTSFDIRIGKADQAILNDAFSLSSVEVLPERFNTTKRKFPDNLIDNPGAILHSDVRILHYVGKKPWQSRFSPLEEKYQKAESIWFDLFAKLPPAQSEPLLDSGAESLFQGFGRDVSEGAFEPAGAIQGDSSSTTFKNT